MLSNIGKKELSNVYGVCFVIVILLGLIGTLFLSKHVSVGITGYESADVDIQIPTSSGGTGTCANKCEGMASSQLCYCDVTSVTSTYDYCSDIQTACPDVWAQRKGKQSSGGQQSGGGSGGQAATCAESDLGWNVFVKGVYTYTNENGVVKDYEDICFNGNLAVASCSAVDSDCRVQEYTCVKKDSISKIELDYEGCKNGCKDGACVAAGGSSGGGSGGGGKKTGSVLNPKGSSDLYESTQTLSSGGIKYTLEFIPSLKSDIDDQTGSATAMGVYLTDYEDLMIDLAGSKLTIVNAKRLAGSGGLANGINLILMSDAVKDTLIEGQSKTYTVGGKNYKVTLTLVDSDEAQFTVNGVTTKKLKIGKGETKFGESIVVKNILYQDYAGGIHSTSFYIGANKLELQDNNIQDGIPSHYTTIDDKPDLKSKIILDGKIGTEFNWAVELSKIIIVQGGTINEDIIGDLNSDGCVGVQDLISVASAFNTKQGEPNYNPSGDWNKDKIVDVVDLLAVVSNYGKGNCNYIDLSGEELDLGEKKYIQGSGKSDEKIDILFIPQNIADISLMEPFIKKIFFNEKGAPEGRGLFNTEPFTAYKDKFNIFYAGKNLDSEYFNCYLEQQDPNGPLKWQLHQSCDNLKVQDTYKIFNPDYIIVIFDLPPGYTSSGGELQFLDIDTPNFAWTFVHEFGHQFGGLADEYITTGSPSYHCGAWIQVSPEYGSDYNCFESYAKAISIYPNIDTLGCPKWCDSYDNNKLIEENQLCSGITEQECADKNGGSTCTWFKTKHPFFNSNCVRTTGWENIGINCIENSQCVFGGDYGQLAFNPGVSIMTGGLEFNNPSKNHLANILQCCYPRINSNYCNTFRSKFINPPTDANSHLKIAYQKIVDCE